MPLGCWRVNAVLIVSSTMGMALHRLPPLLHYNVQYLVSLCRSFVTPELVPL